MQIKYHKNFEKKFKKISPVLKKKIVSTINKFAKNPHNKTLKNHALKGKLKDKRAISVTGDVRIIFEEHSNYLLVIMLDLGTHTQVYNM